MNLNNFTIKAQEAVQQAVQLATQNGQQAIEAVHLLKGVIMTGEVQAPTPISISSSRNWVSISRI